MAVAVLAAACGGGSSPGAAGAVGTDTTRDGAASAGPRLALSATALDFDAAGVAAGGSLPVTLTNVGSEDLVVTEILVDGAGFTATGLALPATLAPSASAALRIGFAAGASGATSATITISSNDDPPAVLTAKGTTGGGSSTPTPTPAPTPTPTPTPVPAPAWSWTKPAGFDAALQAAIAKQPAYMSGVGGQVANPWPQMPGTVKFSGAQLVRTDAIVLAEHFGVWSYKFTVDGRSDTMHSNGYRAEFTGGEYAVREGDAVKVEFGVYFSDEYLNDASYNQWNMFAQFHSLGFGAWGLRTSGTYLYMSPPGATVTYRRAMPSRNTWHRIDWRVKWAHDSTGWAQLRVDGELWFDFVGRTMHDGETEYHPKFGSYLAQNQYGPQVTYETPWVITRL